MTKYIVQIIIRPSQLSKQTAYIINSLDVFKGKGIDMREGETATGEKYVVIKCKLALTNKKTNNLKAKLKHLLDAEYVDMVTDEI